MAKTIKMDQKVCALLKDVFNTLGPALSLSCNLRSFHISANESETAYKDELKRIKFF